MVRPNSAGGHPSSLFRVIKVPVARQHHEGCHKPNPTIMKKLGGYHRRHINPPKKKASTFLNMLKSAVSKIKEAFRLPPSPLLRRIHELEDDIRLLRHKNEILEKGYTIEADHDADASEMGEESSATHPKSPQDVISCQEGVMDPTIQADVPLAVVSQTSSAADVYPTALLMIEGDQNADTGALAVPVPPPAPPLPSSSTWAIDRVPVAPPAPPIGAPAPSCRTSSRSQGRMPPVSEPSAAASRPEPSSCGGGISQNDIRGVRLRPVQATRSDPRESSFRISVEDLFSVPLKPVQRRGRPAARSEDSDNEDFRVLRAAMKQRIESLYSPSVSIATSDREWSISPGFRSRQTAESNLSTSVQT